MRHGVLGVRVRTNTKANLPIWCTLLTSLLEVVRDTEGGYIEPPFGSGFQPDCTASVDEYSCRSGQPEGFPSHRRPALLQLMLRRRVSIALLGRLLYAAVLASSIAQMDWPVSRAAPVGPVVSQVSETSQRDTREGFAWRFSLD